MTDIAKVVEKVVATYTEEKKAEVIDWILKLGIRPDDRPSGSQKSKVKSQKYKKGTSP